MSLSSLPVAVVGGGVAGYTVAVLLARGGAHVTLIEARTTFDTGSGIMLQANALRGLREAGVLDDVRAAGFAFNSTGIRVPDATARLVGELVEGRVDPTLPAAVGIARAQLATILHAKAIEAGVEVRLGSTLTAVSQQDPGQDPPGEDAERDSRVVVETRTGVAQQSEAFALLVGADGANSAVRSMMGIDARPDLMPLGVWRFTVPRPGAVTRTEIINGGKAYFAGYAPTSTDTMYAWLVDDYTDRRGSTSAGRVEAVRALAEGYHGPWDVIRESVTAETATSYTRYSNLLLPRPWHRGRIILIGDAVHACPPTMAQGAAMGVEDAVVLAEMLRTTDAIDDLLAAYTERRLPRVKAVVEGSVKMAEWQLHHQRGDIAELMARTSRLLAQPA